MQRLTRGTLRAAWNGSDRCGALAQRFLVFTTQARLSSLYREHDTLELVDYYSKIPA